MKRRSFNPKYHERYCPKCNSTSVTSSTEFIGVRYHECFECRYGRYGAFPFREKEEK